VVSRLRALGRLRHYKHLPTLNVVLFVSHRRARITIVERTESGWLERNVDLGEWIELERPAVRFSVDELYRDIELES
jgi:hypothetical protein